MFARMDHVSAEALLRLVDRLILHAVHVRCQKLVKEMCVLVPVAPVDHLARIALLEGAFVLLARVYVLERAQAVVIMHLDFVGRVFLASAV
jgi:hypothetical protein